MPQNVLAFYRTPLSTALMVFISFCGTTGSYSGAAVDSSRSGSDAVTTGK